MLVAVVIAALFIRPGGYLLSSLAALHSVADSERISSLEYACLHCARPAAVVTFAGDGWAEGHLRANCAAERINHCPEGAVLWLIR